MSEVRVRFAPSPTGYLHVGGARTALYNWLFAKALGGKFLLRIEDTDRKRYNEEALHDLIRDLKWMGMQWDEGVEVGGDFGPYMQSERLDIYKKYAEQLIEQGAAYYCFATPEELEQMRAEAQKNKRDIVYDRRFRDYDPTEAKKRVAQGEKHVIRLKVPLEGKTRFNDHLRGVIEYDNSTQEDLILMKRDGYPTYHLASVVDDHEMKISHVLRGDEWIASTPKHILLYQAFNWKAPIFCHLPVILAAGGGKLSKRKGAASVGDFRDLGYLPEGLFNYLSLLGWNPGDDREVMSIKELTQAFSIDRIGSSPVSFDEKKLLWMNGQHIALQNTTDLIPEFRQQFAQHELPLDSYSDSDLTPIVEMLKPRAKMLTDFFELGSYFFRKPTEYNAKAQKKAWKNNPVELLAKLRQRLASLTNFDQKNIEDTFVSLSEELNLGLGQLIHPSRLAVSGVAGGPGLYELFEALGQKETVERIEAAEQFISSKASKA